MDGLEGFAATMPKFVSTGNVPNGRNKAYLLAFGLKKSNNKNN